MSDYVQRAEGRDRQMQQTVLTLKGTVENVLFYNEANGYVVVELETEDALVTVVGELGQLEAGEELELTGCFTAHPRFGQQFRADSCVRTLPSTSVNIERYLASGIIRGIGKALSKRIVDEFGEFTLQVIEHSPEKLLRIKGISPQKCEEIAAAAQEIFGLRSLMGKLQAYSVSSAVSMRAFRRWGNAAWEVISENPFRLCEAGIGLPFHQAEKIAADLQIPQNHPHRVIAGFRWILESAAQEGHTCLPEPDFRELCRRGLGIADADYEAALTHCREERLLYVYDSSGRPNIYLEEYYRAEDFIATRIAAMLAFSPPKDFDCTAAIENEEQATGVQYADMQKKAIACAFSRGIMLLTGGPGTGKTTTLNAVIHLCQRAGSTVLLAAPTGRAAKRMTELTGVEAKTIHRLLGTDFADDGSVTFQHDEQDPLSADVVIIDEVSMVDALLFEGLMRALRLSCRLVLVGDEDQLPSVGAGNLLHTLIESNRVPLVRLTEIFRQAQESCIVRSAHQIISGEMPDLTEKNSDFFFFDRRDANEAAAFLRSLYAERLPKAYGFTPQNDIQVISPTRKGILGTVALNTLLQEAVNPPQYGKPVLKNLLYTFREGDKVMQIQNQYEMEWTRDGEQGAGIFNGDMGTVLSIDRIAKTMKVDFDGRVVTLRSEQLDQIELAYAVTVHKSQGSEFDAVLLILPEGRDRLSYRSLLYTAVTRAKKLLIMIGSPRKVREMVQDGHRSLRCSCLGDMLTAMIAKPANPEEEQES